MVAAMAHRTPRVGTGRSMGTAGPVLVGTDGSEHADRAVRWAADFARRHREPLRVVVARRAGVVVGEGGRGGVARALLGWPGSMLVRLATCQVVVVRVMG